MHPGGAALPPPVHEAAAEGRTGRFRCLWAGAQSGAPVITEARLSWTRPTRVCPAHLSSLTCREL